MRKLTIILSVALVVLASATVALAQYPGTVLWKQECPPWATLRINETPSGWVGVECFTFDATEARRK